MLNEGVMTNFRSESRSCGGAEGVGDALGRTGTLKFDGGMLGGVIGMADDRGEGVEMSWS